MRIVFLADSISTQRAGIHYYGRQLIKQIADSYPQHEYHAIASEHLSFLDIEQTVVPISSRIPQHLRLRQMTTIPRIINDMKPDMAIELAHFGPFKLSKSIDRVTVIHDLTPITHAHFHGRSSTLMHKQLLPGIIKKSSRLITNSHHTQSEIVRLYKYDPEKVHVLYPMLHKTYKDNQVNEYESFISNNKKYILSVGTIEPRKDFTTLIEAFDLIADRYPQYSLVIAGQSGWKNQAFFEKLQTLRSRDKIIITGYLNRKTLQSLYENANVYANASIAEGFGLPVLEAMSFGIPLVLSDIPTSKEIAQEAASFFQVGNVESAATALGKLLGSKLEDKKIIVSNRYQAYKTHTLDLPFMS